MARKIFSFIKKEIVFVAAWMLAIVSAFFVPPDSTYLSYIDLRTLAILFSLMIVIAGLRAGGIFYRIGKVLLNKTRNIRQLSFVLIFLCFFSSMLITNDVALITFVPFSIFVLSECKREDLLIPIIVLQTLAANLGSILTPIGNPQNLYLYSLSGMSFGGMLKVMLPYTIASAILLVISILLIKGGTSSISRSQNDMRPAKLNLLEYKNIFYVALFVLAILCVLRIVSFWILVVAVFVVTLIIDRKTLLSADYILLLTFVGFFIFTGNIGRLPSLHGALTSIVSGHEVLSGVVSSQVISNVPAALLLSGFTTNYNALLIGANLGGLGTPIASMASLISLKFYFANYPDKKLSYIKLFTILNVLYLAILIGVYFLLKLF